MESLRERHQVFEQIAGTGAAGIRTLIETHDACLHNADIAQALNTLIFAQPASRLEPAARERMEQQRRKLQPLLVTLPARFSAAG